MRTGFRNQKGELICITDDFNKIADCFNNEVRLFISDLDRFRGKHNGFDDEQFLGEVDWGLSIISVGYDKGAAHRVERHCIERDIVHIAYDTLFMVRDYISDSEVLKDSLDIEFPMYIIVGGKHVHFPDDDVELKFDALRACCDILGIDCYNMLDLCILIRNKIKMYKRYLQANRI